jgi:hypothetical protein
MNLWPNVTIIGKALEALISWLYVWTRNRKFWCVTFAIVRVIINYYADALKVCRRHNAI